MNETTLAALQESFNRAGLVRLEMGQGGLAKMIVTAPGGAAEIYLHGAHVTHYQPAGQEPVLMLSRKSMFQTDKPIRGGIPICWPWFGPRDDDPSAAIHGFARVMEWEVESVASNGEAVEVAFCIRDTPATQKLWPHQFRLRYGVTVGSTLALALETINTCSRPFTFTEALHPYFAVSDVRKIAIGGLENTAYVERIYAPEVQRQEAQAIHFTRRTDRVYYDTRAPLSIHDPGLSRTIVERKENSNTTVVWNPWEEWPKTVPDFAEEEWSKMVCVEPSNAHQFGVTLKPGESHTMRAVVEIAGKAS